MLRSFVLITDFRPVTGGDDGLPLSFEGAFFGFSQAQLSKPEGFWPVAWLALCGVIVPVEADMVGAWLLKLQPVRVAGVNVVVIRQTWLLMYVSWVLIRS